MSLHSPRLLLVDDDPSAIQIMGMMLSDYPDQRFATSGKVALRLAREETPDLILLDVVMPDMTGFDVFNALKLDPVLAQVPVVFVTGYDAAALLQSAPSQKGASVFIPKPLVASQLKAGVRRQLRSSPAIKQQPGESAAVAPPPPADRIADELGRSAALLALTSMADRKRFEEALDRECRRATEHGHPMAVLRVRMDHLKDYDAVQLSEGDACLSSVAQVLVAASLGPQDLVARYDDADFAMLLPETTRGAAEQLAGRVLHAVAGLRLTERASSNLKHVTVSIGIGSHDPGGSMHAAETAGARLARHACEAADLVQAAGRALAAAIAAGPAQVRTQDLAKLRAPEPVPPPVVSA